MTALEAELRARRMAELRDLREDHEMLGLEYFYAGVRTHVLMIGVNNLLAIVGQNEFGKLNRKAGDDESAADPVAVVKAVQYAVDLIHEAHSASLHLGNGNGKSGSNGKGGSNGGGGAGLDAVGQSLFEDGSVDNTRVIQAKMMRVRAARLTAPTGDAPPWVH